MSGVSLGKEFGSGQNEWQQYKRKHGTQTQREAIFKALQKGWSREMLDPIK